MGASVAETFDRSLILVEKAQILCRQTRKLCWHVPPPIGGASANVSEEERLAAVVKAAHPEAYCFRCLGQALDSSPNRLREVAQIMVLADGFRAEQRKCFHCGRVENTILVDEKS